MKRALVIFTAALLAVPGLWVFAKGIFAVARRRAVVQGRPVTGAPAIVAGLILLGWAALMLGFSALVLARLLLR
jgi:hypothetical protein